MRQQLNFSTLRRGKIVPKEINHDTVVKFMESVEQFERNIAHAYASHCRYRGKFHRLLHQRRLMKPATLFIP